MPESLRATAGYHGGRPRSAHLNPASSPTLAASPTFAPTPALAGPRPLVRAALVVLSAALLRAAFPPFGLPGLSLFTIAPLLVALEGLSPRRAALVGLGWGAVSGAANTHWLVHVFPGAALALVPFCWLLMGSFGALYGWGHGVAARRGQVATAVFGPAGWIAVEWLRSELSPLPFSWFTLGHALSTSEWYRQDADLAGVYGLSLLSYATSLGLVRAWRLRRDGRGLVIGLFAVAIPLVFWARGAQVLGAAPPFGSIPDGRASLRVLVVQDEHAFEAGPKVPLTREGVAAAPGPVDAIVWPEISVDQQALRPGPVRASLEGVAQLSSGVFCVGSCEEAGGGRFWNAALLLRPDGSTLGVYHKRVPVPFAEDMVAGHEAPVFDVPAAGGKSTCKVGVLICYDGTFPFVARELVQNGAEVLLTPSMDMDSWGTIQHLEHASFYPLRACELRRPIARAASSGVSLVLDAWGRELARIEPFGPGSCSAVVVPESVRTPYVLGGWLLPYLALAVLAVGGGLLVRGRVLAS